MQCQGKHTPESHAKDNPAGRAFKPSGQQYRSSAQSGFAGESGVCFADQEQCCCSPYYPRASRSYGTVYGGKEVKDTQGALTGICKDIYLVDLIEEHNRQGGKHLQLHEPVCLGYQFHRNVVFSAFTSVYLLGNTLRAINSGWQLHLGFDSNGGLSSTKFDTIGVTTN